MNIHRYTTILRRFVCAQVFFVVAFAIGLIGLVGPISLAAPPVNQIPIPAYSFDAASPSVLSGNVPPNAVLRKGAATDPSPLVLFSGQAIGLGLPGDQLDGISFNRALDISTNGGFVLLFSVDRQTTGDVPPDPNLVAAQAPFNVADQAAKGQAAGDAFVSLGLYTQSGAVSGQLSGQRSLPSQSNTQVLNNYDEGGADFQATPPTSSVDAVVAAQDNVSSMAQQSATTNGFRVAAGTENGLYFTVTADSPSLAAGLLPGSSGADIFYDPAPADTVPSIQRFASASQLGLDAPVGESNEMDGLIVFDNNTNGFFDQGDVILLSLAPGSFALQTIPGVSPNGAADILAVDIGSNGFASIRVFAPADSLGLEGVDDRIDAMEVLSCADAQSCAVSSGIRLIRGDWSNDGVVDESDIPPFVGCLSGPVGGVPFVAPSAQCLAVFDFESDGDVDLDDFGAFQMVFGFGMPFPRAIDGT